MKRSDVELQAEAFCQFHRRRGQPLEQDWRLWADSKDFARIRIRTVAVELLTSTDAVFTDILPGRFA